MMDIDNLLHIASGLFMIFCLFMLAVIFTVAVWVAIRSTYKSSK